MKTILKFIIGLLILILAGLIMYAYFPPILVDVMAGIGFLWVLFGFWDWIRTKLA
jgi:hypothetical protein